MSTDTEHDAHHDHHGDHHDDHDHGPAPGLLRWVFTTKKLPRNSTANRAGNSSKLCANRILSGSCAKPMHSVNKEIDYIGDVPGVRRIAPGNH